MDDQLAATVNGSPIDLKALNAAMQSLAQGHFHATLEEVPRESHAELRTMAMERLIARELIFQAALADGFVADEAAVEEESARILRMMGNPADFWKRLAERGMLAEDSDPDIVAREMVVIQYAVVARWSAGRVQDDQLLIRLKHVTLGHLAGSLVPDLADVCRKRMSELRAALGKLG